MEIMSTHGNCGIFNWTALWPDIQSASKVHISEAGIFTIYSLRVATGVIFTVSDFYINFKAESRIFLIQEVLKMTKISQLKHNIQN